MQTQVIDIMTKAPTCCSPEASLNDVAQQMLDHDCGAIPVVKSDGERAPLGIITDRDIVCRGVARTLNLEGVSVAECMTSPCTTISENESVEELCRVMEKNCIRRIVVVNDAGECTGIVAQADIARHEAKEKIGEVVKKVSNPTAPTIAA